MTNTKSTRSIFSLIAALIAVFLMAAPALAHHKDAHEEGSVAASSETDADKGQPGKGKPAAKDNDGDADSDAAVQTEDTDKNDGGTKNNVADEGDNAHPSGKDRSVENGSSTSNPNQGKAESDPDDDGRGPDRTNGGADKPGGTGGVDKADQDGNNGCGNDDDFEDDNEGLCGKPSPVKPTESVCDADKKMPGTQPCVKGTETKNCPAGSEMVGGTCVKGAEIKDGKITICHATGSATNPYVTITVSVNGLNGHGDHEGDIIPMPAGGCDADDVAGEVITNNPCPFDAAMAADDVNCGPKAPEVDEDDAVKGETIGRDEDNSSPEVGAVAAERSPSKVEVLGAVLPFTGASLLVFLAASLGLIAAGFAALRLRKN